MNSSIAISIQGEKLLNLNIIRLTNNSNEGITFSGLLKKFSLVTKIPRKYSFGKIATLFVVAEEVKYVFRAENNRLKRK
jgi:hypothetical protein